MSYRLCSICRSIPTKTWCWSFDNKEDCREVCLKLQSREKMEAARANGCQLCTMFLDSAHFNRHREIHGSKFLGKEEMLYLRRSIAYPDRAVELGVGPRGTHSVSRVFFYRIPFEWRQPARCRARIGDETFVKPVFLNDCVDNVELMMNWLRVCQEEHPDCAKHDSSFLPTRLLDVQAFPKSDDIRLIVSRSLSSHSCGAVPYLTVSHCWGKTQLITTTSKNIESRKDRIHLQDLSQTFRDAVRFTRLLGQRYLWIDSLCIVQDDADDWAREAAKMAKVYGNSHCTLAALSSADGRGGCHLEANVQESMRNVFFDLQHPGTEGKPYIRIFRHEPIDWTTDYDGLVSRSEDLHSPLRYRAWVLQERELSRRSIHFGKNQLLWECKQTKGSAQLPWLEMKRKKGLTYPEGWHQLVEDYSLRSLTKSVDKLPALSGVAEKFQEKKLHYLAGLWSDDFPAALMWQSTDPHATRHDAYRAPTWSWASLQGRISYDTQRLVPPYRDYPDPRDDPPRMLEGTYGDIKLTKVSITPKHPANIYGGVQEGAYAVLEGAWLLGIDMPLPPTLSSKRTPKQDSEPLRKNGKQIGVFYRDTMDDTMSAKSAFMLVLQSESIYPLTEHRFQLHQAKNMIDTVMGVVIAQDEMDKEAFKRLGLARWVDERFFERCTPCAVKLV